MTMGWSVTGNIASSGLTIDSTSGVLSGTPTTAGVYAGTVVYTDSRGRSYRKNISLKVFQKGCQYLAVMDNPTNMPTGLVLYQTNPNVVGYTGPCIMGTPTAGAATKTLMFRFYDQGGSEVPQQSILVETSA